MQPLQLLNFSFKILNYQDILEYLLKGRGKNRPAEQIISLNPENLILMKKSKVFEKTVAASYGQIIDGVGVVLAGKVLNGARLTRLTGVDLMEQLLREGAEYGWRYLLIGGKGNLAERVANCYQLAYPSLTIKGIEGYEDLKHPTEAEILALNQIVASTKPHLIFVAFGSPQQEEWIATHLELFRGSLVIGVGGAFSMLSGVLPRAPVFLRRLGLEWFYRLLKEPWRIKRQLALGEFLLWLFQFKLKKG